MRNSTKTAVFAFATVFIWASAFPVTKIATAYFAPGGLAFLRCSLAAVILLVCGYLPSSETGRRIRRPKSAGHLGLFFASGCVGFTFYTTFFSMGMLTLTSATSSLLIATTPVLTAIGASLLYNERIKAVGWAAIFGAFCGVAILLLTDSTKGGLSGGSGLWWTMGAAVVFCIYNLLNRKFIAMGYTAVEAVTWSMVCGALLLLPFAADGIGQVLAAPPSAILAVVYLGAMPSAAAYLLWSKAMSVARKTSDVTNFQFVTPLLSTAMGFAMLAEVPGIYTVIGGLIIIGSLVVFGLKGK